MNVWKKAVAGVLAGALVLSMAVSAFAAEKTAYKFTFDKSQVEVGTDAASALKVFGKANSEKILGNCADDSGKDKAYVYDNFDVHTTKLSGKEIVDEITLKTASVATEEGLKIGDTPAQVKKLYPQAAGELGLYTAKLGNTQLIIDCGLKDDKVVSITYQYVTK